MHSELRSKLWPGNPKAWLRAGYIAAWTFSVTWHALFSSVRFPPVWLTFIAYGAQIALLLLTIYAFFVSWRTGAAFLVGLLVAAAIIVSFPTF